MNEEKIRPIHYLGSKLRMIDYLKNIIDEVDSTNGRVYDLFSGSGTVSAFLSHTRSVTAVDVQEYSKILTSALLLPSETENLRKVLEINFETLGYFEELRYIFQELITCENDILNSTDFDTKSDEEMANFIENSSIIRKQLNYSSKMNSELLEKINKTIQNLNKNNLDSSNKTVVTRYYGGTYFSFFQAICLDTLLEYADSFQEQDKNVIVAAVLGTASEIVNTIGKHFAQPLSVYTKDKVAKRGTLKRALKDRKLDVFKIFKKKLEAIIKEKELFTSKSDNYVLKSDFSEALTNISTDTKVIYADPPYTRYHYSRYYHVLETISLRDTPILTTVKKNGVETLSKGIYRQDRILSDFSLISKASEAFDEMFKLVSSKGIPLVLSYSPESSETSSTPRVISIEKIIGIAKKYFNSIEIYKSEELKHSKLNKKSTHLNVAKSAEIIIVMK